MNENNLDQIFLKYEKYIRNAAHRISQKALYTDEEDLYQIGCENFIKRLKTFNPSYGKSVWDYLWIAINASMYNYIKQDDGLIHIPYNVCTKIHFDYIPIENEELLFNPLIDDIAEEDMTKIINKVTNEHIMKYIQTRLTEREQKIIITKFGFDTGEELTLEETAKKFGVTRERIRQIIVKALRKLEFSLRAEGGFGND